MSVEDININELALEAADNNEWELLKTYINQGAAVTDVLIGDEVTILQRMIEEDAVLHEIMPLETQLNVNFGLAETDYYCPLRRAIINKNIDNVLWLLGHGADVHYEEEMSSETALDWVPLGEVKIIEALILHGATIWNKGKDKKRDEVIGRTLKKVNNIGLSLQQKPITRVKEDFYWLAKEGELTVLKSYDSELDDMDINMMDSDGTRLIHHASENGRLSNVQVLIDEKCDIDIQNSAGDTALHVASRTNNLNLVKLLTTSGANTDIVNNNGEVPLHLTRYNYSLMKCLLSHNCDVEAKTLRGETALHLAVKIEDEDSIRVLLDHKAGLDTQNNEGNSPLHLAANRTADILRLLLRDKPNMDITNKSGESPLHAAVVHRNLEIIDVLLSSGADSNIKDDTGEYALDKAKDINIIKLFITHGKANWTRGKTRRDNMMDQLIAQKQAVSGATAADGVSLDGYVCKICYSLHVDTLIKPCHHLCLCSDCAEKVRVCPICSQTAEEKIKLHIS